MEFTESDEHVMLRASVSRIAASFGHEYFHERAVTGGKTEELWQAVAEPGFLSVHLPEEHGGGGGGLSELVVVSEELAAQGCPLLLVLVSAGISAELVVALRYRRAAHALAPRSLHAAEKMVFAITEPDAGSNSHNLATTARRDGDVYRLRGTKTYISGVDEADAVLVVARTGVDEDTGYARLSLFVVDTDAAGIERTLIPVEISAPEKQFHLFFDDVEVPADRLLGASTTACARCSSA